MLERAGLIFFLIYSISFSIKLSPPVVEGRFEGREIFKEVTIINDSAVVKRYEVNVVKPENIMEEAYYLGKTMKVFPKFLSIQPGESKKVRILIEDSERYSEGEYRAYISFEELEKPGQKGIQFLMNMRTSVYALKGRVTEEYRMQGGEIINTGNSSLRLIVENGEEKSELFVPRGGSASAEIISKDSKVFSRRSERYLNFN
ncbi:hypothetical protein PM10SUCC1_08580 [Propionigenium maris DSM 9537]|uniref:Pili assembly chaperone N-terminal domain-containing protein n=1 Tax=Propionigenium maris DSM 9537 TaxID=1123000 RepID=A0A9W6GHJ0_9FUSO|nr:hypothetical protein [Propionigenium maris]GLI55344.1 hypothetical protein PM10SUCC1_08580 [Propionigenium maris DSM 9537]